MSRCPKPKLFVHGSNDEHGAIEKVRALVADLPGIHHLVVVEGADHFFSGKLDQLNAAISSWFAREVLRQCP